MTNAYQIGDWRVSPQFMLNLTRKKTKTKNQKKIKDEVIKRTNTWSGRGKMRGRKKRYFFGIRIFDDPQQHIRQEQWQPITIL